VGRQIINTQGAREAIVRRRLYAVLVLVFIAVAVAATVFFMRSRALAPQPRPAAARVEPAQSPNGSP
jgi:hypothetical protein